MYLFVCLSITVVPNLFVKETKFKLQNSHRCLLGTKIDVLTESVGCNRVPTHIQLGLASPQNVACKLKQFCFNVSLSSENSVGIGSLPKGFTV